jgi:copper transport protein
LLTISASGHAAASARPVLGIGLAWLHLTAASVWMGGLVALLVTVVRARNAAVDQGGIDIARILARFSTRSRVAVLFAWRIRTTVEVHRLAGPADTAYGTALLVKLGLLVPVLAWREVNRFIMIPRIPVSREPGQRDGCLGQPDAADGGRRSCSAAVLLATGVLAGLPPARCLRFRGGLAARRRGRSWW